MSKPITDEEMYRAVAGKAAMAEHDANAFQRCGLHDEQLENAKHHAAILRAAANRLRPNPMPTQPDLTEAIERVESAKILSWTDEQDVKAIAAILTAAKSIPALERERDSLQQQNLALREALKLAVADYDHTWIQEDAITNLHREKLLATFLSALSSAK